MPSGTTSARNKIVERFYYGDTFLRITADYRESTSGLIELLENRSVLLDTTKIPYGDYIIRQIETCIDVVPLRGGYRPKRLESNCT